MTYLDPGYVRRQYRDASKREYERRVSELGGQLEQELASRGMIGITKDTGLFVARK